MAKSVGNIRLLHGALDQFGRDAFVMWMVGAHYRKPVAYTEEALEDAARAVARVKEVVRRLDPGRARPRRSSSTPSSTRWRTTSTRRRRARSCSTGSAEANRRIDAGEPVGPGRARRDAPRPGAGDPARRPTTRRPRSSSGSRPSARRRAPRATSTAPTGSATSSPRPAGRSATRRRAPASCAAVIVYGRNAVREALRGKRRVQRVFATERAAREVWLGDVETVIADPWEIEERCGSPDHQGLCAEAGPYPYVDADSLLDPGDALVLALDEVQDPQNLGAIARVAESAGCTGVVLPERRSAEVTPAVCRASAGAVEHLAIARVRQPRRLAPVREGARERLGLRGGGRRAGPLPPPGLQRAGHPGARKRGPGPPPAGRRDLRRADPPPGPRQGRIAQCLDRRFSPRVRNLAFSRGNP